MNLNSWNALKFPMMLGNPRVLKLQILEKKIIKTKIMNKKQFLNKLPAIILCFIHYVHFVTLNSSIYAFLLPTILKVNSEEVSSWAKSVKHDNFFGSPQKISIFAVFESHMCLLSKKYCGTACAFFLFKSRILQQCTGIPIKIHLRWLWWFPAAILKQWTSNLSR